MTKRKTLEKDAHVRREERWKQSGSAGVNSAMSMMKELTRQETNTPGAENLISGMAVESSLVFFLFGAEAAKKQLYSLAHQRPEEEREEALQYAQEIINRAESFSTESVKVLAKPPKTTS